MKKSTIEKIEKEINEKTKLPNEIKEKIKGEVFTNIVIASIIILYFIFIVSGSFNSVKNVRSIDLNIFSFLFLSGAIFLFEIAYRKEDGKLAIYGIESLVIAIFTLFLPYIIFELNESNKKYYLMASIYIAAYYILKSIVISIKTKNKYMNENISDVKEIVKKEKTKRAIKEDIEEIEVKEKNNKKNVGVAPQGDPQKEQSRDENQIKENTPKKRGRPKKTEISNNQNKKNVGVAQPKAYSSYKEQSSNRASIQGDPQPKKRGRPRKVAVNND